MLYSEDDLLLLSGIQHFAFCERQWALIHIEKQWAENLRTTEGHFLHEKVDDPYIVETRGTLVIARAVPIVSYSLGLSGVADMVEYVSAADSGNGVRLDGHEGYWLPSPVEYKRGRPKVDDRDIVQLCAQAMCLEEMHNVSIDQGFIYYGQTRHRVPVLFGETLRNRVGVLAERMHELFQTGQTPPAPLGVNCSLCSLVDLCMPKLTRKEKSVSRYLANALNEIRIVKGVTDWSE